MQDIQKIEHIAMTIWVLNIFREVFHSCDKSIDMFLAFFRLSNQISINIVADQSRLNSFCAIKRRTVRLLKRVK